MCHYLQKVRQKELLQFKAEFLKDENGNIWLSFIKDFHIRRPFQNSRVANLMQDRGNAEAWQLSISSRGRPYCDRSLENTRHSRTTKQI
jgi:hypothetical protein